MSNSFENSVIKSMLNSLSLPGQKSLSKKCFALLASVVSLLSIEAAALSQSAPAAVSSDEPVLLAQQINGLVAHLQCGPYNILVRFVGTAASEQFSYQTNGLFLTDGFRDGETYHFFNNDFEYRVVTHSGGRGSLTVLHYGETLLTKSCTWT